MGFARSRRDPGSPGGAEGTGRTRPSLSLKGRALKLLAQREQSRLELGRKLAGQAESPEQLGRLLDELEQAGYLSQQRFAESLVHRRASRFGLRRIEQEFEAHRLDTAVSEPLLRDLRGSERDRALDAWRRRFDAPPADPGERARQQRFLAQRGFTGDAIAWVLRHGVRQQGGHGAGPRDDDAALTELRIGVSDDPSDASA
jgi:regulatory protein